jgi:CRISPR-associated protein Csh2
MSQLTEKSELLFLYESTYSIPNGDPFTGEQRYDEETKKILVSDVRIKRFIRDDLKKSGHSIYVDNPDPDNKLTAGNRFKHLFDLRQNKSQTQREFALSLIDVRLFGAVIPIQKEKKKKEDSSESGEGAFNLTGTVQFALLNPSLNSAELRMNQGTSVFVSKDGNNQGAISTSTVVPYALSQIHGWINPYNAKSSGLENEDVVLMFQALWNSINNVNTRSKSNQNSILLIQIVYNEANQKLYGADRFIKIKSEKQDEQIRSMDDFSLDVTGLNIAANSDKVSEIRYYTEIPLIESQISILGNQKIKKMNLF